jgi:serine/threonine protein phosphatase PrpC
MNEVEAGCTANVILITPDKIYCANAGDSRSILVKKNKEVVELSYDHKPTDAEEKARITAAGHFV